MTETDRPRRVLYVAFHFAPINLISSMRATKMVKYLPRMGWTPVVLTVRPDLHRLGDLSLGEDLGNVERINTDYLHLERLPVVGERSSAARAGTTALLYRVARQLLIPDANVGWLWHAVREGVRAVRERRIDLIFSTSYPHTAHLIAHCIQRITGAPWVAELLDLWTQDANLRRTPILRAIERRLERHTLLRASRLITISTPLATRLGRLHDRQVDCIPNAFDEADYLGDVQLTSKFTLSYTGKVYPDGQDPSPLFAALWTLKQTGEIDPGTFALRFYGSGVRSHGQSEYLETLIERHGIGDLVRTCAKIPLAACVQLQKESQALLMLQWTDRSYSGVTSGKLFEYMGARRPILVVGHRGDEQDRLMRETNAGTVRETTEEILAVLRQWIGEWKATGRVAYRGDLDACRRYTSEAAASRLAEIFDAVAPNRDGRLLHKSRYALSTAST